MADEEKKQSLEDWMAEERARLKKGFDYTPKPTTSSGPAAADDVLAGLGVGAGLVGGTVGPHTNPVTFEGVKASTIADALKSDLISEDARVQVDRQGETTVVTLLLGQARTHRYLPALTVTLLQQPETLTVTMGDLDRDVVRGAWTSIGSEVIEQGRRMIFKRRGLVGLIDTASNLIEGVSDVAENVDDLSLPKQVWHVIDRVGAAAEEAYLGERRRALEREWQRRAAERAWTHCPSCGRAYRPQEEARVDCPSCGAPRGDKPDWM